MAKESLKEILSDIKPGDYDKIMHYSITSDDIKDFWNLYSEFTAFEETYCQTLTGRKQMACDLEQRLQLLERLSEEIARGIKIKRRRYANVVRELNDTTIDDYSKALEVLQQLATNESVQYETKAIQYPAYDNTERHGYRTIDEYKGEITILAEKGVLSKFDNFLRTPYFTQNTLLEIYQQGFSMILTGNDAYMTEQLNLPNKQIFGHHHPLVFYLQNDELANAALSFMSFIEENGADFHQIPTDVLLQTIKSKYPKREKINKKAN